MKLNGIRQLHKGRHLSMYEARYTLANGSVKDYEFVSRNNGAEPYETDAFLEKNRHMRPDGVVMFVLSKDQSSVLLMKEFRPAVGNVILNHPMGLVEPGETWPDAARRELKEETGLRVMKFLKILPTAFTAPGLSDQKTAFVMLTAGGRLHPGQNPAEPTEPFWATRDEVLRLLDDPTVVFSALTQATLFQWCCADALRDAAVETWKGA